MKRVILDTNVLVSFLTDRDAEQQAQAAALFEAAPTLSSPPWRLADATTL